VALLPDVEQLGDRMRDDRAVADRAELDQPRAVVESAELLRRRLDCQAGLASAAGPAQCEHSGSEEKPLDLA
jgi:hypothetical protein